MGLRGWKREHKDIRSSSKTMEILWVMLGGKIFYFDILRSFLEELYKMIINSIFDGIVL